MVLEKERGSISNLLWLLTFLVSSWTIVWSIIDMEIWIFRYFTIQSNFLVMLVAIFYYTVKEDKPFFKPLSTIALFNIIVTGVVFHTMLSQFSGSFLVELQHTFVPIIYVIFYFVVLKEGIDIKKFWILLIYPFVYFVIFFIQGIFTNWYPYPFMDPNIQSGGRLAITIFMMALIMALLAFILTYIKHVLGLKNKMILVSKDV